MNLHCQLFSLPLRRHSLLCGIFVALLVTVGIHASPIARLVGAYRSEDGRVYAVSSQEGNLFLLDVDSGWGRGLTPDGNRFGFGATLIPAGGEFKGRAEFGGDSNSTLRVTESGQERFHGRRVAVHAEELSLQNGDITLAATLLRPPGNGPFPAIVLLHGSGQATRGEPWMHALVADGFAVLTFDKRGSGKSTGHWRAAFGDYAQDALAAVRALRSQPEIGSTIGLYGPSQGGYVALLAASQSPEIKFVAIRSTAAVTPEEQETYRLAKFLELRGHDVGTIAIASTFVAAKLAAPHTGDWEGYEQLAATHAPAPWFKLVGGAPARAHPAHQFWRWNGRFDPIATLAQTHVPVLWQIGEFDESSPVARTRERLGDVRAPHVSLEVVPRADHGMLETDHWHVTDEALPQANGYAPQFLRSLRSWLVEQAVLSSRAPKP